MHFTWDWLGPASSIATVIALIITLLYYLYWWPFNLKKPEGLSIDYDSGRIRLSWKSVPRASNYNIYRTNVKSGVMDIYSCTTHHHADTTIVGGDTYQYYVVAEDQGQQSAPSDEVSVTVKPFPPLDSTGRGGTGNGTDIRPVDASPESQWPIEDLHRVFVELQKKDNKTVLAILETTASKPDTPVSFAEVCKLVNVTPRQGGAGIGAFTKLINSLGKTKWPFTHHPSQGGQYYKLSKEMAERWRQVEAEGKLR